MNRSEIINFKVTFGQMTAPVFLLLITYHGSIALTSSRNFRKATAKIIVKVMK